MKRRKRVYSPGWSPPDAVAWCLYHDRGCNDNYIRRKHCLTKQKGRPCRHLMIFPLHSTLSGAANTPNNHHINHINRPTKRKKPRKHT